MDYILITLASLLFLFIWFNSEYFSQCSDNQIETVGSMEQPVKKKEPKLPPFIVKRCCPANAKFSTVVWGNREADSTCCQNFIKKKGKKDSGHNELPNKAGACTSTFEGNIIK